MIMTYEHRRIIWARIYGKVHYARNCATARKRKTTHSKTHAAMYDIVTNKPSHVRLAARSGRPMPMNRPTIAVSAIDMMSQLLRKRLL